MIQGQVSTIVLNWRTRDVIERCIDSLLVQTYINHEIVVVDNGSHDGSLEIIKGKYAFKIKLIENQKNLGFDEGVNTGIRNSEGEFIALLNSDAIAKEDWIANLVSAIKTSDSIGMCASKTYLMGRDNTLDNTGEVICRDGLGRGRGRLEKDTGQYDQNKEVLCPSGGAAFYRRKMLDEIGYFDSHFFIYGDDIDVGLRSRLIGYECVYVSNAIVYHDLSTTFGVVSPLKAYLVERNRLWVVLKCFPLRHLMMTPFYTMVRYFYHFLGLFSGQGPAARYAKKNNPLTLFLIILKAYFSTLWFFPYLMTERMKIMRKRKLTNKQFEENLKKYSITVQNAALNELS